MRRRAGALLALAVVLVLAVWDAPAAAAPRRYRIETDTSQLTFKATSRVQNADGKFHRFGGEVSVDPGDLSTTQLSLSIEAASIDTRIRKRDDHLRSEDFFAAERFPTVTFQSTRVESRDGQVTVIGRLTMRGVTREVAVPVSVEVTDATVLARGEFTLKRTEYGINYQSVLNPVADEVRVAFEFRARRIQP